MALSSIQLARLVQAYVAEPGGSLEEKATRIGVRRNELLRAAQGTIPRTTSCACSFSSPRPARAGGGV